MPFITMVDPFVGDHSETWEEFGFGPLPNGTSILGGIATINGMSMETSAVFVLCTVGAVPSDGITFMDQDRPDDLVVFSFSQPVSAFGAYWGSGVGCFPSYRDAATILTFQDQAGNVIGTDSFFYTGDGALQWHGYNFATPVKTIIRTADDNKEGVAIDGLQAIVASTSATPTPTGTPSATGTPTATPIQTVETPIISPSGGMFRKKVTVRISDATAAATIYYTLDGSDPTTASIVYIAGKKNKGFKLTGLGSHTLKAKAVAPGFNDSAIATAVFDIN